MSNTPSLRRSSRPLVAGLALLLLLGGGLYLLKKDPSSSSSSPSSSGQGTETTGNPSTPTHSTASSSTHDAIYDGGPIEKTIADRRVRDELRRRILEGWAQEGDGERAAAAKQGRLPPMPTNESGEVNPKYIQSVIREDMFPMAAKCYEELQKRKPKAAGRIELAFKIVGDDKLGGIIEEAEVDGGVAATFGDEKMETCLRESLLSLSFRPPPKDGWVTIIYPIVFSPHDEPDN